MYLLLEFQSTVNRFMAVRVMTYVGLLYHSMFKLEIINILMFCMLTFSPSTLS